jgi:hypothetical protein
MAALLVLAAATASAARLEQVDGERSGLHLVAPDARFVHVARTGAVAPAYYVYTERHGERYGSLDVSRVLYRNGSSSPFDPSSLDARFRDCALALMTTHRCLFDGSPRQAVEAMYAGKPWTAYESVIAESVGEVGGGGSEGEAAEEEEEDDDQRRYERVTAALTWLTAREMHVRERARRSAAELSAATARRRALARRLARAETTQARLQLLVGKLDRARASLVRRTKAASDRLEDMLTR